MLWRAREFSTLDRSHYEITVLKTIDSRGGSSFMHDCVTPGTKLTISCRAPHMKGSTKVVFDHDSAVECTAYRVPMCMAGLKNNPDDAPCEDDPNLPKVPDPLAP